MDRALVKSIAVAYYRSSFMATALAAVAFACTAGVLAAVMHVRAAVVGTEIGDRVVGPIAFNGAVSWFIASAFCLPLMVNRAFTQVDYFTGCLKILGWPARRQFLLIVSQFCVILVGGALLSVPVAAATHWLIMMIPRESVAEPLYPPQLHQPLSAKAVGVAVVLSAICLVVAFVGVLRRYAVGRLRQSIDPRPIRVTVARPRLLEWSDLLAVIGIASLVGAGFAGIQAGLFVVIGFVFVYLWVCTRWTLHAARGIERLLARATSHSPIVAAMGALVAELHQSLRAIVLPMMYVVGVPAILLSVSRTEAVALHQESGGIHTWDFMVMLALPLLYLGALSVNSFVTTTGRVVLTSKRLGELGMSYARVQFARFFALPIMFVGIGLLTATVCAVVASAFHTVVLSSSISAVGSGLNLTVSFWLAGMLLACFFLAAGVRLVAAPNNKVRR